MQQAQPNNGRMEVDLEGVCLQLDTFRPHDSPYAWRLAFSIHQMEVNPPSCLVFQYCLSAVSFQQVVPCRSNRLCHVVPTGCAVSLKSAEAAVKWTWSLAGCVEKMSRHTTVSYKLGDDDVRKLIFQFVHCAFTQSSWFYTVAWELQAYFCCDCYISGLGFSLNPNRQECRKQLIYLQAALVTIT